MSDLFDMLYDALEDYSDVGDCNCSGCIAQVVLDFLVKEGLVDDEL